LQIGTSIGHAAYITTSTSDELFSRINIDDFCKTMNFKNKGFYYLRQGGNVFARLCLFVCLFVCVSAR